MISSQQAKLQASLGELSAFPLFKNMKPNEIAELCSGAEICIHKHRELIFEAGQKANRFGFVLSGAYKLSRVSPSGEDAVIHFSCPGDVVAALVMPQAGSAYPVTVRSMGPSRMLLISREVYNEKWLARPQLIMQIQSLLSTRMSRFQNHRAMQRAPLTSKVASLLLQLAANEKTEEEVAIPIPLTRKEIADTLGVTVESVIRVMSEWDKKGIINTADQNIKILQPALLVQQAEG